MSFDKRNEEIRKQRELRRTDGKKTKVKRKKTKEEKGKKKTLPIVIIAGLIIAITLTVLSLTVFFKVSHINVSGTTRYETKQIITASEITTSQNIILLSESKVEERIMKALPYIGNVTLKKNLFTSTVTLVVTDAEPFAAIKYNDEYILINSEGRVLEKTKRPSCGRVFVENVETPEIGKTISFGEQDEMPTIISLAKMLSKLSIKDVSAIDLSNSSDVRMLYKDTQIWKLGTKASLTNADELEYKLKFCLKESQNEEGKMGIVDVSAMTIADETKYGYFREEVVSPEEFGTKPTPPVETSTPESSENEESSQDGENEETDEGDTESSVESDTEQDQNALNDGENDL